MAARTLVITLEVKCAEQDDATLGTSGQEGYTHLKSDAAWVTGKQIEKLLMDKLPFGKRYSAKHSHEWRNS